MSLGKFVEDLDFCEVILKNKFFRQDIFNLDTDVYQITSIDS